MQVARAGDIVAVGGLKDVITGETLCDEKAPVILERMEFPDPVIKVGYCIQRLLSKVMCPDPCLQFQMAGFCFRSVCRP